MKLETLINSKAPEDYNDFYWRCLNQRHAWLFQRWLNQGNTPIWYLIHFHAAVYITDDDLSLLFQNEKNNYIVRYIERCFWVIWQCDSYYLVLTESFKGVYKPEYSFPYSYDKEGVMSLQQTIEYELINMIRYNEPSELFQMLSEERFPIERHSRVYAYYRDGHLILKNSLKTFEAKLESLRI